MNNGPKTGSLNVAHDVSGSEAVAEERRSTQIRLIAEQIQAGWQGSAADGASGAAGPLADAAKDAAQKQHTTQTLLAEQSGSFLSARGNLRDIAANAPQSNLLNDLTPWETDLDREIKKYQQDSEHNLDIYSRYDEQSLANEGKFPLDYPAVADPGGNVSVTPPSPPPIGPPPPVGPPPPGGGHHPVSPPPGGGVPPGPVRGGPPQVAPLPPVVPSPQLTTKQEALNQAIGPVEQTPDLRFRPPAGGPPPVGGFPVGPVPVGGRGPGTGSEFGRGTGPGGPGGSGRSGGSGTPGSEPGGRGATEGGRGSGAGGARAGAGGESGLGGRTGAGGLAAEAAAARRGGVPGRGGAGSGMGGLGGGHGQGDEDLEHQRPSYLTEPDPEAVFGTDQATAPPVIGE